MHGDTRTLTVQIGTSRDLRATNARRDPLWRKVRFSLVGWTLIVLWLGMAIGAVVTR